ncbi:hypothetical protein HPP92_004154 [Vanilla planifolia]|uniref:Uncharacterized protein n=1 Tax=Vanilla planifolia TaxID=51239 RepID=A0A835VM55_VANPL|nr:hypothetical protein HPP92_004154 [Vanilla planifolia]
MANWMPATLWDLKLFTFFVNADKGLLDVGFETNQWENFFFKGCPTAALRPSNGLLEPDCHNIFTQLLLTKFEGSLCFIMFFFPCHHSFLKQ